MLPRGLRRTLVTGSAVGSLALARGAHTTACKEGAGDGSRRSMIPGVRRSRVLGLPVYCERGVRALGRVDDLLLDRSSRRVVGFLLTPRPPRARRRIVPFEAVRAIGPSAILLRTPSLLAVPPSRMEALHRMVGRHRKRLGVRLLDPDGVDRGTLDDLAFDPASGALLGFSVSRGLVADATRGQAFLPSDFCVEWGDDGVALLCDAPPWDRDG